MTLEQTLDQLKAFGEQPGIMQLVNDVEQYAVTQEKFSAELSETILCQLRARLATVANDNDNDRFEHESLTLADAAYQVLIALAELSPANQEDVITLESVKDIASQKLIIVSTGHHFDIEALIERHNTREYQSTRGENAEGKFLYNEMTKLNFSAKDAKRIHQKAAELTLIDGHMTMHLTLTRWLMCAIFTNPTQIACFYQCVSRMLSDSVILKLRSKKVVIVTAIKYIHGTECIIQWF